MDGAAAGIVRNDAPGVDLSIGDNQPELPILDSMSRITQRRLGLAVGVAVVMADDPLPGTARLAVRAEQGGRINFKGALRMIADIFGWNRGFDAAVIAEQQAARFVGVGPRSFSDQGLRDPACNCHNHPDIG